MADRDEALRRAQEAMRRLQHEVRTPLSQIMGYSELLEEELDERGQQDLAPDLHRIRDAAQRLLDLVDGKLRTERDPGAPQLSDEPEAAAEPAEAEAADTSPGQRRVLVVDSDADIRDLLARRLAQHDFSVETAKDGVEALRRIDAFGPDVVLLEVLIPGMNGLEVLERVRRHHSMAELPVILATQLDASEDCVEGLERGANDYVTKPFDFPVVVARIRSQLEAHRLARQVVDLSRQLEFRSTFIRQALGREVADDLLVEMAERPDALSMGAERRRVTAVVADLRRGRALADALAPPHWAALLRNALGGLGDVVAHYEGTLDSVTGDSLVALFGLPLGRDDDVERATACAVAMQLEVAEINAKNHRAQLPEVELGVGVATGGVVVVGLGTGDQLRYKAVGEPLAEAARIEAAAAPGEVWICEETFGALGAAARVDAQRDLARADGAKPVTIHRTLGVGGSQLISLRPD